MADGSWRPDPTAFGQFAAALAKRYSGSFPDPLHPGHFLPRVTFYQAWAEQNLAAHIAPQWTRQGQAWVPTGATIYRSLLNAFYTGVKGVHSNNQVLMGGLAPYGDPPGGTRMHPAAFLRSLLCLQGRISLTPQTCPDPAHFDILASDPYEVASPTTHAFNSDDVSAPDLGRLTRIANNAVRTGRALPRRHKQLWVTEFGYDSKPPNPYGLPLKTQARWLEQSFYVFWSEGVNTVLWYLVRDQAGHNFNLDFFSGVYFYNGKKKPSFEAYRFPLVVGSTKHSARIWGISPRRGSVKVQDQQGHSWKTLFRLRASAGGVFVRNISPALRGNFRAVAGGETSLVWHK
jgi:hypothetical protein